MSGKERGLCKEKWVCKGGVCACKGMGMCVRGCKKWVCKGVGVPERACV